MNLNMEMTKYKLGDIATIYDGPHATPKRTDNGPVYLGIDAITEDCKINPNEFTFLSEEDYKIWTKRVVPQFKDIVFSYEATLGRYAIIPENFYGCLGRRLGIIRVKSDAVDYKWLYYFFQSPQWKCYIKNHIIKGSTVNRISVDEMPGYEIPACGIADQKKIASVLSALDDKIALNKKMNQKLEAMAKRLYDYWFVQYDFPDKNGHPYKTTGGPMTYNTTLKREIPAGWEVSSFTDFGFFKNGINYDKNEIGDETVKIVNVRNISDSTTYFNIDELDDITLKSDDIQKFVATPKDILLARSGSPGATRLLPQTDKKIIYCGFIIRYQLNEQDLDKQLYLFHVLKGYEQVTSTQSAGSILKNISQDTLNALMVVMPQSSVLDAFNKKIAPIYSMLRKNICELNKLTALRDKLLPLLMNGQVVVG